LRLFELIPGILGDVIVGVGLGFADALYDVFVFTRDGLDVGRVLGG
jgi:hypothetical protein